MWIPAVNCLSIGLVHDNVEDRDELDVLLGQWGKHVGNILGAIRSVEDMTQQAALFFTFGKQLIGLAREFYKKTHVLLCNLQSIPGVMAKENPHGGVEMSRQFLSIIQDQFQAVLQNHMEHMVAVEQAYPEWNSVISATKCM